MMRLICFFIGHKKSTLINECIGKEVSVNHFFCDRCDSVHYDVERLK